MADELLSAYLTRVAVAHGATPFSFCRVNLGDTAFWARDVDRAVSARHELAIAEQSGFPVERVRDMTLTPWAKALTPPTYGADRPSAVVPWINVAGIYHRVRRLHGLQFCPECLEEGGAVERRWRLSFAVACVKHRRLLDDSCPRCDAPYCPHRSNFRPPRCHDCGESLTRSHAERKKAPGRFASSLQSALVATLDAARDRDEPRTEMRGLRALAGIVLARRSRGPADSERLRLETARNPLRHAAMEACGRLLADWPNGFRDLAREASLRIEDFATLAGMPPWLAEEISRLPPRRQKGRTRSRLRLDNRLDALRSDQPENWRAVHAMLMMRAASRRP